MSRNFRGLPTYAFAHAKVSNLIFYFKFLKLIGHISIIFLDFEFPTDSAKQFLKTSIHVEFQKNPGIDPTYPKNPYERSLNSHMLLGHLKSDYLHGVKISQYSYSRHVTFTLSPLVAKVTKPFIRNLISFFTF